MGRISEEFSFRTRRQELKNLDGSEFEVLIIGGGISGAGAANILAENGVKTLLVERGDFASGTSSGSSKLIHGGLRYLANGQFREVRDLLKERNYLLGHTDIVKPMKFYIVVDQYSWKKYTLRLGLFLYNLLSGRFSIPRFSRNDGTFPPSVKGYFEYMDAYTDDSSMVVYNIISAKKKGAICLNYVEATDYEAAGETTKVTLKDSEGGGDLSVSAKILINAGGPWAGKLMGDMGVSLESTFRLSKGVHLVVPAERIPVKEAVAFRTSTDRRQMFVIPRGEVVHVGTTDTFIDDPEDFSVTDSDIDYVISSVKALFPSIGKNDIIAAFAGIRPLFGEGDDPGKVSRDFEIRVNGNVLSILGGKVTNYRSAARKVASNVSSMLGRELRTNGLPTIDYSRPAGGDVLEHIIMNECPLTVEDVMRRRAGYRIYCRDGGKSKEKEVLAEMKRAGMDVG